MNWDAVAADTAVPEACSVIDKSNEVAVSGSSGVLTERLIAECGTNARGPPAP